MTTHPGRAPATTGLAGFRGTSVALRASIPGAVLAIATGVLTIAAAELSGADAGGNAALQVMGFDPDRATLIVALTVAALTAGAAAIVTGRRTLPVAMAFVALGDVFGPAFVAETSAALAVHGPAGFRPGGWAATLVTLVAVGLATGWAAATLAREIRRWLLAAWRLAVGALTGPGSRRPSRRQVVRAVAPIAAVALVVASLPTFGDMINYTPDVAMTGGGFAAAPPLVGGDAGSGAGAGAGTSGAGSGSTSASAAGPAASAPPAAVTANSVSSVRPWAAHPPSGQGRIAEFTLPAPWSGTRITRTPVWLYLPPGYDSGSQRYPVVYTVPWDLSHWSPGIHVQALLDQAITQGAIPPSIVAFVDLAGGPFPNSECADSYDGREHADTYVSKTVVDYVDSHYRTIASADARTIAGFSQGGFCAANLLLRHPTVFHQAIAFAGYFVAGLVSGETVNAWEPWGHVASIVAANSPMVTATRLAPGVRRQLFVVIAAQPNVGVFGQQATAFANVLQREGYPADFLGNQYGHAWKGVRLEFVPALQAVAAREVLTGALQ